MKKTGLCVYRCQASSEGSDTVEQALSQGQWMIAVEVDIPRVPNWFVRWLCKFMTLRIVRVS